MAVESHGTWLDPDHSAHVVVAADPAEVCAGLAGLALEPAPAAWTRLWSGAERAAQEAIGRGAGRPSGADRAGRGPRTAGPCLPRDTGLVRGLVDADP